jgi:hypothetical protein
MFVGWKGDRQTSPLSIPIPEYPGKSIGLAQLKAGVCGAQDFLSGVGLHSTNVHGVRGPVLEERAKPTSHMCAPSGFDISDKRSLPVAEHLN